MVKAKWTGRSRRWLGAALPAAGVLAAWRHDDGDRGERGDQAARRDRASDRPSAARLAAATPAIEAAPAEAAEAEDPELDALAGLPPEDVEWVLDRVERTQSVRALSAAERLQLMSELASIRMFAVLERTEAMTPPVEVMP